MGSASMVGWYGNVSGHPRPLAGNLKSMMEPTQMAIPLLEVKCKFQQKQLVAAT